MHTSKVTLLDLREAPDDRPAELAGGVVVVDDAGSLVEHAEIYLSLVGEDMVTAVVCVAVGQSTMDDELDGVALAVPPALRHATVLWIGDPRGVDWAPEHSAPRPAEGPADALDGLVAALTVPAVFDRVVAAAEGLSSAAANPGIRLVSGAAEPVELAEARAAAVQSLCATDHPPAASLAATMRRLDAPHDQPGAVLSGPVSAANTEAFRRLNQIGELVRQLGTPKALFGSPRPTAELGNHVAWASQAAENYRRYLGELLNRMDGQLQVGHPPVEEVMELGVADPMEARGGEIAAGLRAAVDARVAEGVSIAVLAQEMRMAAVTSGPQGLTATLDQVSRRGPLVLNMPAFRAWPLRLGTLPLIFLSCLAVAFLAGPSWLGAAVGGLYAAAWFGSGWLLLGRRPGPQTEVGLGPAAAPAVVTYGLTAVLGAVAGAVEAARRAGEVPVPAPGAPILIAVAVLLAVAAVALSWRAAVRRWQAELGLPAMVRTLEELTRITEEATAREWQPMRRHRAIAAAAADVAAGLEEIVRALADTGNRLFVAPRVDPAGNGAPRSVQPTLPELYGVVRGDLVDVCREALAPVWPAIEVAGRTTPGAVTQRLDRLLGEYGAHVRRHGLMAAPRLTRDLRPRDSLVARVWSESPAALAALRTGVDGDMTQLCRSGQLRYLSTVAEPSLVRFGPAQLRRVLEQDGAHQPLAADPGIVWSAGGELVGALRLVPLRPESIRHVLGGAPVNG
ncbi:MAG TPA: hypothetical protein VGX25_17340 [Actinophytocola sp.]|uniref:hypothetical protein n=1 Tax=Actinophytocola sp. TaxID=1872138 RepID=UPI002DDD5B52|nr:hypothetical protein [Actinophytocola sp.]HEV2781152.1 hypothetical protein [Actinophytocola sp.]